MKSVLEAVKDSIKYENLNNQEKINYIKNMYNLSHGFGKNNKKKKGRKK